jgi:hypothetical protein
MFARGGPLSITGGRLALARTLTGTHPKGKSGCSATWCERRLSVALATVGPNRSVVGTTQYLLGCSSRWPSRPGWREPTSAAGSLAAGQDGKIPPVASYFVNKQAVAHCRRLIDGRQYVLDSDWGEVQPDAAAQNTYLKSHSWEEYAQWHLGLTEGARDETKARYAFVYGDFRRVHRTGLIACVYRAAEWRHKDVELAAHDLLQHLDKTSG